MFFSLVGIIKAVLIIVLTGKSIGTRNFQSENEMGSGMEKMMGEE